MKHNRLNSRNSQQNTSTRTKGTEEIRGNGQGTNTSTTKGSGDRNNTLELLIHALLTVTSHNQTLFLQLLRDITGARSGNLNPGLGEHSAGGEHEQNVEGSVEGINKSVGKVEWGRHVIRDTRDGEELSRSFLGFPDTENTDKKVVGETIIQHLGDEENVGTQSRL